MLWRGTLLRAAARPVLSPTFAHVHLLSGKTSLRHKPQRHFLKDLLKVRLQFKLMPGNAPVFNEASLSLTLPAEGGPGCILGGGQGLVQPPPITRYAGENKPSTPTKR